MLPCAILGELSVTSKFIFPSDDSHHPLKSFPVYGGYFCWPSNAGKRWPVELKCLVLRCSGRRPQARVMWRCPSPSGTQQALNIFDKLCGDKKGQMTVCMHDEHFWTCAEVHEKWFLSFNPSPLILSLLPECLSSLSAYISWAFPICQVLPGAGVQW